MFHLESFKSVSFAYASWKFDQEIESTNPVGGHDTSPVSREKWQVIAREWEYKHGKLKTPTKKLAKKVTKKTIEPVSLDKLLPRLSEPVLTLADLIEDAKLFQIEELQALESAMAVRDVLRMAELAYLAELAINQEKLAVAGFIMFMD